MFGDEWGVEFERGGEVGKTAMTRKRLAKRLCTPPTKTFQRRRDGWMNEKMKAEWLSVVGSKHR